MPDMRPRKNGTNIEEPGIVEDAMTNSTTSTLTAEDIRVAAEKVIEAQERERKG